jgi:AcrR family transcriptional regulator
MEEFASHGYEQASYNRIIERAGVSKGAMYYYFDDKEDLFTTVIRTVTDHLLREFSDFPAPETPEELWTALRDFMTRALGFMREHPVTVGVMKSALALEASGSANAAVRDVKRMYRQWAEAFISQAQALGAIRSDMPYDLLVAVAIAVATSGDMWVAEHFEELEPADWDRLSDQFIDLFRHGLGA